VGGVTRLAWRFATGAPLNGRRRTDATFLHRGRRELGRVPGWWDGKVGRWAYLPGYQRAAARWAGLLLVIGWFTNRWLTVLVALAAAGVAAWRLYPRALAWWANRHIRHVVQPLYVALAGQLGLSPDDSPGAWVTVPADFKRNHDAVVRVELPAHFSANVREQKAVNELVAARLGGEWDAHWHTADYYVTFTRPPRAPSRVAWAPSSDEFRVYVGQSKRDQPITVNVATESPHGLVAAGTGAGKTSTLLLFILHALLHGWVVDIIDPKRRSFLFLRHVPGVRIHTDIESMIRAVEEFYLSMDGVNAAVELGNLDPARLFRRLLVIDEMTSFIEYARNHYRRSGGKGDLPTGLQIQYVALQGRQAEHRMVVAPHQADAKIFGGTAVRGSFGFRLVLGAMNRTLWVTAFGYAKQVAYNARIKGRGLIGLGEGDPEEIQFAHATEADVPGIVAAAPEPPAWFTAGGLPPWVTTQTIEQAATVAGVGWLSPWVTGVSLPADQASDVPAHVPSVDRDTSIEQAEGLSPSVTVPSQRHLRIVQPDDEPQIVGMAAAARFLGYEKQDSFKRARARNPIPGETRTEDGRPAWSASALRSWHSKRQIAGAREIPGAQ
jgi:hypothetical protein